MVSPIRTTVATMLHILRMAAITSLHLVMDMRLLHTSTVSQHRTAIAVTAANRTVRRRMGTVALLPMAVTVLPQLTVVMVATATMEDMVVGTASTGKAAMATGDMAAAPTMSSSIPRTSLLRKRRRRRVAAVSVLQLAWQLAWARVLLVVLCSLTHSLMTVSSFSLTNKWTEG